MWGSRPRLPMFLAPSKRLQAMAVALDLLAPAASPAGDFCSDTIHSLLPSNVPLSGSEDKPVPIG